IRVNMFSLRPGILVAGPAMEHRDVVSALQREPGEGTSRETRPADQQQLHALLLGHAATAVKALGRGATCKTTGGHPVGCTVVPAGVRTGQSAPDAGAGGRHLWIIHGVLRNPTGTPDARP